MRFVRSLLIRFSHYSAATPFPRLAPVLRLSYFLRITIFFLLSVTPFSSSILSTLNTWVYLGILPLVCIKILFSCIFFFQMSYNSVRFLHDSLHGRNTKIVYEVQLNFTKVWYLLVFRAAIELGVAPPTCINNFFNGALEDNLKPIGSFYLAWFILLNQWINFYNVFKGSNRKVTCFWQFMLEKFSLLIFK